MITSPFFGYYIFLPGTGTGCTWVVTTFVKTVSKDLSVSMPSWAWVVTLTIRANQRIFIVSMPSWAYTSFLRSETVNWLFPILCVNALMGLYLISTKKNYEKWICYETVSMPSRAYTSFLRYPFKNLGFMRFPEPVFAGIYQNILTTAVFRAC